MKYPTVILLILFSITHAAAQPGDTTVASLLLPQKYPDCDDIGLNAAVLIPRFYRENKMDTVRALANMWARSCNVTEPLASFLILDEIKNRHFSESLRMYRAGARKFVYVDAGDSTFLKTRDFSDYYSSHIVSWLYTYEYGCNIRNNPYQYSPENTSNYIVSAYAGYYDFLQSLARSATDLPGLSTTERFLVDFYAHPDSAEISNLGRAEYDGTVLQKVHGKQQKAHRKPFQVSGWQFGFTTGSYLPDASLPYFNYQPYLGITTGARFNRVMIDFSFSYIIMNAARNLAVKVNDTVYKTNSFNGGGYGGLDCGYQLFRRGKSEFDLLAGAGIQFFTPDVVAGATDTSITLNGADISAGLGYKVLLRHRYREVKEHYSYITLQAKYHFIEYSNPGGSEPNGRMTTLGVVYGWYIRRIPNLLR